MRRKGGELHRYPQPPNGPLTNSMIGSVEALTDERQGERYDSDPVEWI
jgi:hypothetical protein